MDEIDSSRTSWMLSPDEGPWSEKSEPLESPPSNTHTKISGPGFILPPSLVSSSYGDCGFPWLQSSLTASTDSGHPSSLQTSSVSLESSFSCFNRSSSLSTSFNEEGAAELSTNTVVSPDEGYDYLDFGQSSTFGTFDHIEHDDSALYSCVSCSKQSDSDTTDSFVSGSHDYTKHHNQPVPTVAQIDSLKPSQLAALLKNGLEKYLLIDSRSFLEFNDSHIQQSTNVCCSKLVKRRLQRDKVHIKDFLMQTCHIDIDEFMEVVVYDQCTESPDRLTDDNFLSVLLNKLSSTFKSIALLKGGFLAFQAMYPSLCESKTNNYRCAALTSLSQPCLPVSNVGPTRILPFLYLGSQQDALSADIVKVNEITYILNVSTTCIKPGNISDGHFLRIPVNDNYSAKLTPHFEQAFQFLDKVREANGCCLVHCLAGISRSPTLAIAYIMKHLNMSSDDAYRYVKDKRPTISPNFNFLGQLLEYEKYLKQEKQEKGVTDSSNNDSANKDKVDIKVPEFTNTKNSTTMSCPSIPWKPIQLQLSPQTTASRNELNFQNAKIKNSQGLSQHGENCKIITTEDGSEQKLKENFKHKSLPSAKSPVKHFFSKESLKFNQGVGVDTSKARPCVLNFGLDTSRRLPVSLGYGHDVMSQSLSDIKEASETPSPIVNLQPHEYIYSTSLSNTQNAPPLLSPFPCGETTIPVQTITEDQNYVPYSGNIQRQTSNPTVSENSSVVTSDEPKHFQVLSSLSESKQMTNHLTSMTSDTQSATVPFSLSGPFLKAGGKRPLRSSLSLSLSPVAPHSDGTLSKTEESNSALGFSPSACKIERKVRAKSLEPEPTHRSNIPMIANQAVSCTLPGSVTMSHKVKLKSFDLSSSLPLALAAQSPTTCLARLHFDSAENSDDENETSKMDTQDGMESSPPSKRQLTLGFKSFNENLEKLSSFPSTSLDKLNFTPCLSSSSENLQSNSSSPRSGGVKRPLNIDIVDLNENTTNSKGSQGSFNNLTVNNSASSVTNNQPKVVVKKREGRAKRPMVRPNSIAFSTYPTFDLGSDCQGSPNSASSSASQDDTSELYALNGKKSKHSEYMADVKFRLGHYSEREVYRQITAAMEAAMMKSQSFDASRKSRSLDDILSSEDDSSAPNCEFSHFDRVLRHCGLNRDKFTSPPLLEKLACVTDISEHYQSNSSLSSTSSHTSLHGSMELIQVS